MLTVRKGKIRAHESDATINRVKNAYAVSLMPIVATFMNTKKVASR